MTAPIKLKNHNWFKVGRSPPVGSAYDVSGNFISLPGSLILTTCNAWTSFQGREQSHRNQTWLVSWLFSNNYVGVAVKRVCREIHRLTGVHQQNRTSQHDLKIEWQSVDEGFVLGISLAQATKVAADDNFGDPFTLHLVLKTGWISIEKKLFT